MYSSEKNHRCRTSPRRISRRWRSTKAENRCRTVQPPSGTARRWPVVGWNRTGVKLLVTFGRAREWAPVGWWDSWMTRLHQIASKKQVLPEKTGSSFCVQSRCGFFCRGDILFGGPETKCSHHVLSKPLFGVEIGYICLYRNIKA